MTAPAAVVFDNDGLLLDTEEAWTRAEVELFARRGRTFTAEHKAYLLGSSYDVAAAKLGEMLERPEQGTALMDELHELVMEEALAGVPPRPGAFELLDALAAAGMPLALASNSPREFVERTLDTAGLTADRRPFAFTVCADEVEHGKPAPDLYLAACAALGVDPAASVALEDSPPGVAAAAAAGMVVVGVPYVPGHELPGATHLAGSLADELVAEVVGLRR